MVIARCSPCSVSIVAFFGVVHSRRRWVSRQSGAFKGAVRVVDGEGRHARPSDGAHAGKVPAGAVIEEIFATYDWLL